jgi:multicomponent Na+:H+ antiporter subunit E
MRLIKKPFQFLAFAGFFLRKLVEANLFIARDLLTPKLLIYPEYVKVPIILDRDYQILLLANLISMTPGSLVVDVAASRQEILVHSMYARDKEKVRAEVDEFQVKIKNLFS